MSTGMPLAVESAAGAAAVLEGDVPSRRRLVIMKDGKRTRVARRGRLEYAGTADFSPDGSRLAVVLSAMDGSKQVQVVDVATGKSQLLPLPSPQSAPPGHTSARLGKVRTLAKSGARIWTGLRLCWLKARLDAALAGVSRLRGNQGTSRGETPAAAEGGIG